MFKIPQATKERILKCWLKLDWDHYVPYSIGLSPLYFKVIYKDGIKKNDLLYTLTFKGMWVAKKLAERHGIYSEVDLIRWRNEVERLAYLRRTYNAKRRK
jgi:hypothetical protein